jgi:hypothetical protein
MPPSVTGKQRAARIPLDYYKRPNFMERWKGTLALLAFLVTVGVAGAAWVLRDGGRPYVSRGPVASVHAAWDDKCEACHTDFRQQGKGSVTAVLFGPSAGHDASASLRCEQCHDGTVHHGSALVAMTPGCGGCHRDHRGREASLVWLPDADCTQCHSNLKASTKEGKTEKDYDNAVTSFADKHPKFRSLDSDPGRLKFNHRLHMLAGQVVTPDQASPWTLGKIADKATRERYANAPWQKDKSDNAAVVLDCASCHRLDAGDFGITDANRPAGLASTALTPRAVGAYMLPVNYEIHCSACHPLTFDPNLKGADGQLVSVPHRIQPDAAKDFVWGAYAEAYGKKPLDQRVADALKAGPKASRPLPGKLTEAEKAALGAVGKQTEDADQFLFKADVTRADGFLTTGKTACGECHVFDTAGGSKKILPLMVKNVWLEHAKFSHVSHRAADCRLCHANAYGLLADGKTVNSESSIDHTNVLIAGIESCRQCHSPAGGVRSDCTECHNYHHGDKPWQGLGAAARDPGGKDDPRRFPDVRKFLTGTRD